MPKLARSSSLLILSIILLYFSTLLYNHIVEDSVFSLFFKSMGEIILIFLSWLSYSYALSKKGPNDEYNPANGMILLGITLFAWLLGAIYYFFGQYFFEVYLHEVLYFSSVLAYGIIVLLSVITKIISGAIYLSKAYMSKVSKE